MTRLETHITLVTYMYLVYMYMYVHVCKCVIKADPSHNEMLIPCKYLHVGNELIKLQVFDCYNKSSKIILL